MDRNLMRRETYPEDIQCIVEGIDGRGAIFVSNIEAALNPSTLEKNGIGSVITAIKGRNLSDRIPKHIEYLYVPAVDSERFDISFYFSDTCEFILEERKRTNVLVHCMAGVSRSVTLVMAYLMEWKGWTMQQTYQYVARKRKIIAPNPGFLKQLKDFEGKLQKKTVTKAVEKEEKMKSITNFPTTPYADLKHTLTYDEKLKENINKVFVKNKTLKMAKSVSSSFNSTTCNY